jgi:hypothetical protein
MAAVEATAHGHAGISPVSTRLRCPRPAAIRADENPNTMAPSPAATRLVVNRRSSGNAQTGPVARPTTNSTL